MLAAVASARSVLGGKYRLESVLGAGATGTVWRAIQLGLERPVAIKLMHAHLAAHEDAEVRFSREARVAASLDHPSSVAVLDFGKDGDVLYLVMELVDGESLRDRIARAPLALPDAVAIVRQVATALAAAHRLRLVHRDIKPENVILPRGLPPPPAKVVDFGLAFIVDPIDASLIGRVTAEGAVVGTPAYMAPEQVRAGSIGPPSDIYSLGCVFYELIAGRPPFVGGVGEVFTRHAYAPALPLRQLPLDDPPPAAIDELIQAMLAKSAPSRPSAARVVQLLAAHEGPSSERAGRTSVPVIERAARAIAPALDDAGAAAGEHELAIGVIGELDPELELALAASQIQARRWAPAELGPEPVVWVAGASPERIAALTSADRTVVVQLAQRDATLLPALIRAGVADAVAAPIDPDDLVRRLLRAHRLHRSAR